MLPYGSLEAVCKEKGTCQAGVRVVREAFPMEGTLNRDSKEFTGVTMRRVLHGEETVFMLVICTGFAQYD